MTKWQSNKHDIWGAVFGKALNATDTAATSKVVGDKVYFEIDDNAFYHEFALAVTRKKRLGWKNE